MRTAKHAPRARHCRSALAIGAATLVLATLTIGATYRASGSSTTQGVTKDSIKVGIAIVDYGAIKDFVDFNRGDQQKIAQTFVDDINAHGGVGGRKIIPVYKEYPPIPGRQPDPLSLCTSWAEDEKVFAVLGVFIDFTGQAQLCLTREHHLVHIGHELDQPWIDAAPPGLLLTTDSTKEQGAKVLVTLLGETGKLKGKKVAVLASKDGEQRAEDVIVPALRKQKVKLGSTGILNLTGPETEASRAQLQAFIERWKTEDVDAVFLSGLDVTSKGYMSEIKRALPKALLMTDASSTVHEASDEVIAGTKPNPYDGMLSVLGLTASERWAKKSPLLQKCVDVYEKASGTKVLGPDEEKVVDGKKVQIDVAVTDFCSELSMFKTIAEKAGPNLTTASWQKAVNSFGEIDLVSTPIGSLCKGKYAADDAFRLVTFDPTVGTSGDWKAVTPVRDASGGVCTK
jgi:ABC-type branched-subunit amino acid transport system substrate-binding protein